MQLPAWLVNVGGFVLAVLAWLASPQVMALLPADVAKWVGAIGVLLGLFGIHAAVARNDQANSDIYAAAVGLAPRIAASTSPTAGATIPPAGKGSA